MAEFERFGKPIMTNLPRELGTSIFNKILSTPRPDFEKMREKAERLEKKMLELRLREDEQRDSAK